MVREPGFDFGAVVGESPALRHAINMAHKVSTTPIRALFMFGEAGTGKELVARCIHNTGLHPNAPFVTVDCAGIPAPLLEAELFGQITGRSEGHQKLGVLELVGRGTVFLEEVGDLPMALQSRLLCALEEYSIPRFGGASEAPIHCRVIASSKSRLEDRVAAGTFRADLLARLAVLRIDLPPLRDRDDDAQRIADHILTEAGRAQGLPAKRLGLDAGAALRAHRWPGNVRELKHVIERSMVICDGPLIAAEHLMINQRRIGAAAARNAGASAGEIRIPSGGKRLRDIEREALELTLQLTGFNQSAAARILCISRPTLARKLRAYGLANRDAAIG
jgi:two-component system, NtrC family, response regulator AtoC